MLGGAGPSRPARIRGLVVKVGVPLSGGSRDELGKMKGGRRGAGLHAAAAQPGRGAGPGQGQRDGLFPRT